MTEYLDVRLTNKVLEIGTGSGYQAAILSQLAREVCSIEVVPELAERATVLLHELGYRNVRVRVGDGYAGWPEDAPFDRILLTAAPLEVPPALIEQLAPGGRLIAPVGAHPHQELILIDKSKDGHTVSERIFGVSFVPMVPGHLR